MAEAVNLRRDSPLKASRRDAFYHSVMACPERLAVIGIFAFRAALECGHYQQDKCSALLRQRLSSSTTDREFTGFDK
jgi:hypothetical protein